MGLRPRQRPCCQTGTAAFPAYLRHYPAIYGHTELLPPYGAIIQAIYAPGDCEDTDSFKRKLQKLVQELTLTDWSVSELMRGQYDVLFDDLPTIQNFLSRSTPEILPSLTTPLSFSFISNPVTDLSLAQLKVIYAGGNPFLELCRRPTCKDTCLSADRTTGARYSEHHG